jgi:hypothetical protein
MQERRQFQKFGNSAWKKEAVQSSQNFRDHLKTETFFQMVFFLPEVSFL